MIIYDWSTLLTQSSHVTEQYSVIAEDGALAMTAKLVFHANWEMIVW